nr:putative reverse transcriptase domain-containing protein [Tanacetum cinerariifolium]
LTKLMRKGEKFVWNEEREKSFEELKQRIVSAPVEGDIIRDLERLGIELYVSGQQGYWASRRIKPDLISRIKETQKKDSEIWTIVENLDKQVEFRLDDDNVLW